MTGAAANNMNFECNRELIEENRSSVAGISNARETFCWIESLKRGEKLMGTKKSNPLSKLADDEQAFVLRGRDVSAPATICFWIAANISNQECSDAKLTDALAVALAMRRSAFRRAAD